MSATRSAGGISSRACSGRSAALAGALCLLLSCALGACSDDGDRSLTADTPDVTVVSLNILHGLFCPPATQDCRLADRLDLFFDWLEANDCPDVVLLQEVLGPRAMALIEARVPTRCAAAYQVLAPPSSLGQNYTLSRYPALQTNVDILVGDLRRLWHTQIDHPTGVVDIFNTHFAAGIDLQDCDGACPPECTAAGTADTRECQAVQVAILAGQRAAPGSLRVLAGDFNATPASFVYRHLVEDNGWADAYLVAGNPECDPVTGSGCTSGRDGEGLGDMESPDSGVSRRIDYLFFQSPPEGSGPCRYTLDSHRDVDGDGLATRIFADDPNPFADGCGPLPLAICWPSDHEGMQADFNCEGSVGLSGSPTA